MDKGIKTDFLSSTDIQMASKHVERHTTPQSLGKSKPQ